MSEKNIYQSPTPVWFFLVEDLLVTGLKNEVILLLSAAISEV